MGNQVKLFHLLFEELEKNKWQMILSTDAKEDLSDELIALVQNAYSETAKGSFVNTLKDVISSDWYVIDWDEDPEVDGAIFWRKARANEPWSGNKIQGIGHDGQSQSKKIIIDKLKDLLNQDGWWIEANAALRKVLLRAGTTAVEDINILQTIFPNSQITMIDQNTYTRTLPDGSNIIETLFGKPEIK